MRLRKKQKEAVLAWIAEGLQTDEINRRAKVFDPPFTVTRQHVDHYRKSRKVPLTDLRTTGEHDAINTGLALRDVRVGKLQQLAEKLEQDLLTGDKLWVEDEKSIGPAPFNKFVVFKKFNDAEVSQYRGLLDDIAKETGGRQSNSVTGTIDLTTLTDDQLQRLAEGEPLMKVLAANDNDASDPRSG